MVSTVRVASDVSTSGCSPNGAETRRSRPSQGVTSAGAGRAGSLKVCGGSRERSATSTPSCTFAATFVLTLVKRSIACLNLRSVARQSTALTASAGSPCGPGSGSEVRLKPRNPLIMSPRISRVLSSA